MTNLLRLSDDEAGEHVVVESTTAVSSATVIQAYVDDDGIVRQQSNGAAFNADAYEVAEQ